MDIIYFKWLAYVYGATGAMKQQEWIRLKNIWLCPVLCNTKERKSFEVTRQEPLLAWSTTEVFIFTDIMFLLYDKPSSEHISTQDMMEKDTYFFFAHISVKYLTRNLSEVTYNSWKMWWQKHSSHKHCYFLIFKAM